MNVKIPDFAQLLAPYISVIPEASQPAFLAQLEKTAAQRYRDWAQALPQHAKGLIECAEREDEIAIRIEKILPAAGGQDQKLISETIAPAKSCYYQAFSAFTVWEQLYIQANAERQGAAAWRMIASQFTERSIIEVLEACSSIEEKSADYVDALLATRND
jgi:hypothetical protein